MWWNKTDSVTDLIALLEEERSILLSGDILKLEGLETRKAKLLKAVAREDASKSQLDELREKSKRNEGLLSAARGGLDAARVRLENSGPPKPFSTYDPQGKSTEISLTKSDKLARRA